MAIPRILSIGKDAALMSTISLATSDLIDVTIICHTVFQTERHLFISTVRQQRQLLPILCLRSYPLPIGSANLHRR